MPKPVESIDPKLKEWATQRQSEVIDAINETGSIRAAARKLGVDHGSVSQRIAAVRVKAASAGYAPGHFDAGVAPSYRMGKVTIQRTAAGVERVWERQHPDSFVDILDVLDRRIERLDPVGEIAPPISFGAANLLNHVTISDGHVGALAWAPETGGANWNLEIAHDALLSGACWLMDNLPAAEELLLMILGDFTDSDGYQPLTPASKHLLDVDGRFPKIADAAESVIEKAVLHGLTRYVRVRLVIKPGNHDPLSAFWMRKLFTRIFAHNPRVIVEQSIRPYWAMLFGQTMISSHHGDKAKLADLPGIFAADFAQQWGSATYRVCHTGHMHHKKTLNETGREHRGMMIFQHPTLASRNAWAADKGLSAAREIIGHTYHSAGAMVTTLHFSEEMRERSVEFSGSLGAGRLGLR